MIVANISCKLSCIGNYASLTYNKDDVISILSSIDDPMLSPSIIQEINPTGQVTQRMQFVTNNGLVVFAIHSDRIDITVTSDKKQGFSNHDKVVAKEKIVSLMEKILSIFYDRVDAPNRLAWNPTYVIFETTDEEKRQYRNRFVKEVSFFQEKPLDEFLVRYATRKEYSINDKDELFNVLTTISSVISDPGSEKDITGYKVEYDINTWQGNKKCRFDYNDIKTFVQKSIDVQIALDKEFLP